MAKKVKSNKVNKAKKGGLKKGLPFGELVTIGDKTYNTTSKEYKELIESGKVKPYTTDTESGIGAFDYGNLPDFEITAPTQEAVDMAKGAFNRSPQGEAKQQDIQKFLSNQYYPETGNPAGKGMLESMVEGTIDNPNNLSYYPGVGEIYDAGHLGRSLKKGNYEDAAYDAAGFAIPFVGGAAVKKFAKPYLRKLKNTLLPISDEISPGLFHTKTAQYGPYSKHYKMPSHIGNPNAVHTTDIVSNYNLEGTVGEALSDKLKLSRKKGEYLNVAGMPGPRSSGWTGQAAGSGKENVMFMDKITPSKGSSYYTLPSAFMDKPIEAGRGFNSLLGTLKKGNVVTMDPAKSLSLDSYKAFLGRGKGNKFNLTTDAEDLIALNQYSKNWKGFNLKKSTDKGITPEEFYKPSGDAFTLDQADFWRGKVQNMLDKSKIKPGGITDASTLHRFAVTGDIADKGRFDIYMPIPRLTKREYGGPTDWIKTGIKAYDSVKERGVEGAINNYLGNPYEKGHEAAIKYTNKVNPGEDEDDAVRHGVTANETAKIVGKTGANILGLGHELANFNTKDGVLSGIQELGEDVANNFIGSVSNKKDVVENIKKYGFDGHGYNVKFGGTTLYDKEKKYGGPKYPSGPYYPYKGSTLRVNKSYDKNHVQPSVFNHGGPAPHPKDTPVESDMSTKFIRGALNTVLPTNASQLGAAFLTGDSKFGLEDSSKGEQLALYKSIVNAHKRNKEKTGLQSTEYIDYSKAMDTDLQHLKGSVPSILGGSALSDEFNAATTYGRVSYEHDPETNSFKVYDNYDFTTTPALDSKYAQLRNLVGNAAQDGPLAPTEEKGNYLGAFNADEWDEKKSSILDVPYNTISNASKEVEKAAKPLLNRAKKEYSQIYPTINNAINTAKSQTNKIKSQANSIINKTNSSVNYATNKAKKIKNQAKRNYSYATNVAKSLYPFANGGELVTNKLLKNSNTINMANSKRKYNRGGLITPVPQFPHGGGVHAETPLTTEQIKAKEDAYLQFSKANPGVSFEDWANSVSANSSQALSSWDPRTSNQGYQGIMSNDIVPLNLNAPSAGPIGNTNILDTSPNTNLGSSRGFKTGSAEGIKNAFNMGGYMKYANGAELETDPPFTKEEFKTGMGSADMSLGVKPLNRSEQYQYYTGKPYKGDRTSFDKGMTTLATTGIGAGIGAGKVVSNYKNKYMPVYQQRYDSHIADMNAMGSSWADPNKQMSFDEYLDFYESSDRGWKKDKILQVGAGALAGSIPGFLSNFLVNRGLDKLRTKKNNKQKETLKFTKALGEPTDKEILEFRNQQKHGGYMQYANGGQFDTGGQMGEFSGVPVTEFNNGGSHETNPNGGIPLGSNASVEAGELGLDLPNGEKFIVSPKIMYKKNDKEAAQVAQELGITEKEFKKYAGRDMVSIFKALTRKNSFNGEKRDGDTIQENSIEADIMPFVELHTFLTEKKNAEEEAKKEQAFAEDMDMMMQEHPEYMQAMMAEQQQQQAPQQQQGPSPEEQAMMQQQQMAQQGGAPQEMPPMMAAYGGTINPDESIENAPWNSKDPFAITSVDTDKKEQTIDYEGPNHAGIEDYKKGTYKTFDYNPDGTSERVIYNQNREQNPDMDLATVKPISNFRAKLNINHLKNKANRWANRAFKGNEQYSYDRSNGGTMYANGGIPMNTAPSYSDYMAPQQAMPVQGVAASNYMYGGGIPQQYKYGAGMGIASDVLGGAAGIVGTAVPWAGAALGATAGMANYASQNMEASDNGTFDWNNIDYGQLALETGKGVGAGALGAAGSLAVGAAGAGIDHFADSKQEKINEERNLILQDPTHPEHEETKIRELEKQKALKGTGAIGAGIGVASNIIGGQVDAKNAAGIADADFLESGANLAEWAPKDTTTAIDATTGLASSMAPPQMAQGGYTQYMNGGVMQYGDGGPLYPNDPEHFMNSYENYKKYAKEQGLDAPSNADFNEERTLHMENYMTEDQRQAIYDKYPELSVDEDVDLSQDVINKMQSAQGQEELAPNIDSYMHHMDANYYDPAYRNYREQLAQASKDKQNKGNKSELGNTTDPNWFNNLTQQETNALMSGAPYIIAKDGKKYNNPNPDPNTWASTIKSDPMMARFANNDFNNYNTNTQNNTAKASANKGNKSDPALDPQGSAVPNFAPFFNNQQQSVAAPVNQNAGNITKTPLDTAGAVGDPAQLAEYKEKYEAGMSKEDIEKELGEKYGWEDSDTLKKAIESGKVKGGSYNYQSPDLNLGESGNAGTTVKESALPYALAGTSALYNTLSPRFRKTLQGKDYISPYQKEAEVDYDLSEERKQFKRDTTDIIGGVKNIAGGHAGAYMTNAANYQNQLAAQTAQSFAKENKFETDANAAINARNTAGVNKQNNMISNIDYQNALWKQDAITKGDQAALQGLADPFEIKRQEMAGVNLTNAYLGKSPFRVNYEELFPKKDKKNTGKYGGYILKKKKK